jgi:hypothetical protein
MDPATLATTAVTVLSPYLVKAGEKAAEKVGEKLPGGISTLWNTVMARVKGKPAAEEAVKDLVVKPDDPLHQSAFANQLRKVLETEPGLAAEVERLLSSAQPQGGDTIINTGSGAVATRGSVGVGAGGIAIQGDVQGGVTLGGADKKG